MNKLLIFLIIPAVLSRAITIQPPQQEDASITGYQFLSAFVNAERAGDYSIYSPDFVASIEGPDRNHIREVTKEELFLILRKVSQDANIEQVFPRDQWTFKVGDVDGKQYVGMEKTQPDVNITISAQILGENQFSLEGVLYSSATNDASYELTEKLI